MNSAQKHWKRQINTALNDLADHGDSFDETGKAILQRLALANAAFKANA